MTFHFLLKSRLAEIIIPKKECHRNRGKSMFSMTLSDEFSFGIIVYMREETTGKKTINTCQKNMIKIKM